MNIRPATRALAAAALLLAFTISRAQVSEPVETPDPQPAIAISGALEFGDQAVGVASPSRQIVVSNAGNAPLSVGAPAVTGPSADDYLISGNTCLNELAEGDSCTIEVVFTPTASGPRPAELSIPSSAPDAPLVLGASGNGVAVTVSTPLLPFDMPSKEILRQSPKKVFAHYVPWFPISIDNLPAAQDHYTTQLLNPAGEGGKHQACGGLIRSRPLPQPPSSDPEWRLRNMEKDVRRAITIGIDGFAVDIPTTGGQLWDNVILLLRAAANVDPGFKILLTPDMDGVFKTQPEQLRPAMIQLSKYPAVFRHADGRLVVSPFNAQNAPASLWAQWLAVMRSSGVEVAFVPLFQGWRDYAADYQSTSAGFADWGTGSAVAAQQANWTRAPIDAHQYLPVWMAPVRPQVFWPCNYTYHEAAATLNFRLNWATAILGRADWVNLLTWNDYAEGTQIAPSTQTQQAFYDLTAYYIAWFKTGKAPTITRDVIYYFHRPHHTTAVPDWSRQTGGPIRFGKEWPTDARRDIIEVAAFLKAPGTVEVRTDGPPQNFAANAGQNFFTMPIAEGRPSFRLTRGAGGPVLDFQSAFTISNTIVYQDLLYRGGSSSRVPVAQ